jgi:pimeloyl-ACP methyl ester carboxylesterase
MADDVLQVMNRENIEECILLGHSMGGKVAMQFAAEHPEKLIALIIADIAPKRYKPGHYGIIAALKSLDFTRIKSRSEVEAQLSKSITDPAVRNFLTKNLQRTTDGHYRLRMNIDVIDASYDHIIGEIPFSWPLNVPTLFLKGEQSRYIQDHDRADIEQWFTEVEFEEVSKAGHWLHADNPNEFLSKIENFLSKQDQ